MSGSEVGGPAIEVRRLSKHFDGCIAVDDCSFEVPYGRVTGLLGPNGAGKSTTFRMVLGLVRPTSGESLVDGVPFARHACPGRAVGSMLEMTGFYPGCDARAHLRIAADVLGVGKSRVDEVLGMVGLSGVARRSVHKLSLGMRQRLLLGMALLASGGCRAGGHAAGAHAGDRLAHGTGPPRVRTRRGGLPDRTRGHPDGPVRSPVPAGGHHVGSAPPGRHDHAGRGRAGAVEPSRRAPCRTCPGRPGLRTGAALV